MNRRRFLLGMAAAALGATTRLYGLADPIYQGSRFSWDKGLEVANVDTLLEWSQRMDPGGNLAEIAELLSQTNEILDDMVFKDASPKAHRIEIKTRLPEVVYQ